MKRQRTAASLLVAAGILLSRISGLIRERIFAHYLGNSEAAGAFKAALRIPNFLQNLFGEGVLSASFIPVYSRLLAEGQNEVARRLSGLVGSVLMLLVCFLVLIGVLATPIFVELVAPGFTGETRFLVIEIVRILFPGVGLLVISAWCLGILNSHRHFFLSYVAPVCWNVAMIAALLIFGRSSSQSSLAVTLAWASVVGSLLQLGIQLPLVIRYAPQFFPFLDTKIKEAQIIFRNFGPVLLSRGVVQLSAYLDGMIASFLGASAVSSLAYAQTLYLLPISLFGMAVAAAELPEMSATLSDEAGGREKLRERVKAGCRQIAFFVTPSVIGFFFLGKFVVAALYQTGIFGPNDTLYVWYILMGAAVGLQAATWGRLYSSAFYALGDTKTPLRFALIRLTLTVALGLLFAFPFRPFFLQLFSLPFLGIPDLPGIELGIGVVGLTASAGIAGWIEYLLLQWSLCKRIGSLAISFTFVLKVWGAAIGAGLLTLAIQFRALPMNSFVLLHYDLRPLIVLVIFGGLYLAGTSALGVEETGRFWKKFSRGQKI